MLYIHEGSYLLIILRHQTGLNFRYPSVSVEICSRYTNSNIMHYTIQNSMSCGN